jgi:hypothetical protein
MNHTYHHNSSTRILRRVALASVLFVLIAGVPVIAAGPFVETDVLIIHTYEGENIGDGYGWTGANLGDLDGDSADDYGVTAPFYGGSVGKAYVYSGQSGELLNSITGVEESRLGYSMAGVGDVNGDNTPDYAVGGFGAAGYVALYSGVDHSLVYSLTSPLGETEGFGADLEGAGDVNGDGRADLVVGAANADVSETITNTGRMYLLSGVDGSVLWEYLGQTPQGQLGRGVGGVGDVNGDGTPDVVGAAPGAGENALGEVYVFSGVDGEILLTLTPIAEQQSGRTFGTFFASAARDIDQDGDPDIFVGDYAAFRGDAAGTGRIYIFSGKDGSPLQIFEAEADGDGLGVGRGIPDINGDGNVDLILAAWTSSAGTPSGGKVYVHSGADGALLHTVTGAIEGDSLGVDALWVGDVNGDDNPDYMVTGVGNDFNGTDVGHVYIVSFVQQPALTLQPGLAGCQPIQPR